MTTHRKKPGTAVPINGAVVRELRIRCGLSVQSLAREVGIDRSYLTKIEVNDRQVSPEVFRALQRALGLRDPRVLTRIPEQVTAR